jgi:choline dehydrogenase
METYDHIVIGAGSAGAAVAARLSEDPRRTVLLIEAGGTSRTVNHAAPAAYPNQFLGRADWAYETEPEPGCDDRRIYEPRAKALGGCSAMNAMIWIRGNPADYDAWGLEGWGWDDVRPVFERIEHRHEPVPMAGGANDGPVHVSHDARPNPMTESFIQAAASVTGVPVGGDLSSEAATTGLTQQTVHRGHRWSTARAYLDDAARRPNLTILTRALVTRIVIRDGRALGIEYERFGRRGAAGSRDDVVLCAGAFNTPHLLQLSGIGDPGRLRSIGIEPLVDSPHVGEHLAEHPALWLNWELRPGGDIGLHGGRHPKHVIQWATRRAGILAATTVHALAHVRSDEALDGPDLQLLFVPAYVRWQQFGVYAEHPVPALAVSASYWSPRSEGRVWARSADAREKPAVLLNLLTDRSDLEAMIRATRIIREIAAAEPLRSLIGDELTPGPDVVGDERLERWLRAECEHTYHPSCTARMSADPADGVVDAQLRVHGLDGLRVADCSVFPRIPRANTNAASIMVGERCAALVRSATPS